MKLARCILALAIAIAVGLPQIAQAADPVPIATVPIATVPIATVPIATVALQLDQDQPNRTSVGKLIWRGGLVLQGNHVDFGGYSGLKIEDGGKKLRALSDTGTWLALDLQYDANGTLIGAGHGLVGPLRDLAGQRLVGKINTDAESMAVLPDGSVLVGFEQKHRVWRYPPGKEVTGGGMDGTPVAFAAPDGIGQAPANQGLECITLLADGRLLLISEDLKRAPDKVAAWIGVRQGNGYRWQDATYPIVGRFRPSDATTLPNGDVVVLERSYTPLEGVRVRIMRLRVGDIAADSLFRVEELARLEAPVITENLEGVSALRGPKGETLLWLIADDNFNPLQRTILLHFAIAD